ncbi:hypothetical protein HDA39_000402 [Kribbella italica]|uniref:Uncharacterized protein n=1 Tax=Kribbella italica TaxID=1540520 RepID=A0A7W9J2G8_9ACTN|nr:hypothetical protein [Kribbella italica]
MHPTQVVPLRQRPPHPQRPRLGHPHHHPRQPVHQELLPNQHPHRKVALRNQSKIHHRLPPTTPPRPPQPEREHHQIDPQHQNHQPMALHQPRILQNPPPQWKRHRQNHLRQIRRPPPQPSHPNRSTPAIRRPGMRLLCSRTTSAPSPRILPGHPVCPYLQALCPRPNRPPPMPNPTPRLALRPRPQTALRQRQIHRIHEIPPEFRTTPKSAADHHPDDQAHANHRTNPASQAETTSPQPQFAPTPVCNPTATKPQQSTPNPHSTTPTHCCTPKQPLTPLPSAPNQTIRPATPPSHPPHINHSACTTPTSSHPCHRPAATYPRGSAPSPRTTHLATAALGLPRPTPRRQAQAMPCTHPRQPNAPAPPVPHHASHRAAVPQRRRNPDRCPAPVTALYLLTAHRSANAAPVPHTPDPAVQSPRSTFGQSIHTPGTARHIARPPARG